jgi:hypothetical protein
VAQPLPGGDIGAGHDVGVLAEDADGHADRGGGEVHHHRADGDAVDGPPLERGQHALTGVHAENPPSP